MKRSLFVWLLGLCLFFPGLARAQNADLLGKITPKRDALLKVMADVGCPEGWLNRVIADTPHVTTKNLRLLHGGQEVRLKGGKDTCKEAPSKEEVRKSRIIIHNDRPQTRPTPAKKKVVEANGKVAELETTLQTVTKRVDTIEKAVAKLTTPIAKAAAEEAPEGKGVQSGPLWALAGFLLGSLVVWALNRPTTGTIKTTMLIQRKVGDEVVNFDLIEMVETRPGEFVAHLRCRTCGRKPILVTQVDPHMRESHPLPRVTVNHAADATRL